ncbi:MAG: isochorismate synthase [Xanthomonadales bacterium]|nr:isochorismate synthase [Xanthomonadales bacterium]
MMLQANRDMETQLGDAEAAPYLAPGPAPTFLLQGGLRPLRAQGLRQHLPAGSMRTLDQRVADFFAAPDVAPQPLLGLLPFDPDADTALYQPRQVTAGSLPPVSAAQPAPIPAAVAAAEPAVAVWADMVAHCAAGLARRGEHPSRLHKLVLARSLRVELETAVDLPHLAALAARLAGDPGATAYLAPIPVADGQAPAWLLGATPELLVSRRGDAIASNPLAGSAPRRADAAQDQAAAKALLASAKDRDEHRYVVEAMLDTLAPLCRQLDAAEPTLQSTRSMWHLGTGIRGRLKDPDVSAATLAALLHPTPAVCGTPQRKALGAIRRLEPVERGFYAGAVGWVEASGDGDWYLTLRCAHVQGNTLRLFAGAGIVADSQAALEVQETDAKFQAMLQAFGIEHPTHTRQPFRGQERRAELTSAAGMGNWR